MQYTNTLSPKEIRQKWAIALESGFFEPCKSYLRILSLKDFKYRHSPLGVLCAVSQLGEFIPEMKEHDENRYTNNIIRHIYCPYTLDYLPSANSKTTYTQYEVPPNIVFRKAGIAASTYSNQQYFNRRTLCQITELPANVKKYIDMPDRFYISIDYIMDSITIPQHEKFPIIAQILKHIDARFSNVPLDKQKYYG